MKLAAKMLRGAACLAIAVLTGFIVYYNNVLPDNYYVSKDSGLVIGDHIEVRSDSFMPANYSSGTVAENASASADGELGSKTVQLRLFGVFPIKDVSVTEVDEPVVIPCGTPFGIKLMTEGVLVVELTGFESGRELMSPAKDAGIREGDVILSISGKDVNSNSDISSIIAKSGGQTLGVEIERDGEKRVVFIKPVKADADSCYKAGMWVRDSSAGIGTVTFYDPSTGIFGGLGHPVCDADTGDMLTMAEGQSAEVIISGVNKSVAGDPGELVGMFVSDKTNGELLINSSCGLFGRMDESPSTHSGVPVAMRQEIRTGSAQIYSTINGCEPELYDVEIEKINLNGDSGCRDMIVRVTDEKLLEKAGGIVQGMSGSPIIQDGKLVGAVTHVLVKDPTRGYAIFADSMLECAEMAAGSVSLQPTR